MGLVTTPEPVTVSIGIDVGQRVDPSAIVVAQHHGDPSLPTYLVRHLERLPINTSYPRVAERVAELVVNLLRLLRQPVYADGSGDHPTGWLLSNGWDGLAISLFITIDATGVGRPVVELITAALEEADLEHWRVSPVVEPATFNHGDHLTRAGDELRVGKAHLVSRLQALLATNRIKLPNTGEARALAEELKVFEIRVSEDANDRYGAFKVGTHDDLCVALGLAVLKDREPQAPSMAFGRNGVRLR